MQKIYEWLDSDKVYTVRYAIGLLLSFYLDNGFSDEHIEKICNIRSEEYYINMMIAWYFATAVINNRDEVIDVLKKQRLDVWVHNKTIQKAIESKRVDENTKAYLKTLKIKKY